MRNKVRRGKKENSPRPRFSPCGKVASRPSRRRPRTCTGLGASAGTAVRPRATSTAWSAPMGSLRFFRKHFSLISSSHLLIFSSSALLILSCPLLMFLLFSHSPLRIFQFSHHLIISSGGRRERRPIPYTIPTSRSPAPGGHY